MTKDEIIQMAEDCGIRHRYYEIPVSKKGIVTVESCTDRLLKFADLLAEAEREACAKLCDDMFYRTSPDTDYAEATEDCAKEIRARGEKPPVKTYAGGKPNYCTPEHDVPQP